MIKIVWVGENWGFDIHCIVFFLWKGLEIDRFLLVLLY
jgi:hypothetical protein